MSLKLGIPLDVLPTRGLTARQTERMERINDSDLPRVSTQQRAKEESSEERKARKQAIKEERKVGAGSSRGWRPPVLGDANVAPRLLTKHRKFFLNAPM